MKFFKSIFKVISVSIISTYSDNCRIVKKCFFKGEYSVFCIMNICCTNMNREYISHNIRYNMTLYSFCFFLRHILFYHYDMLFLRFANLLMHNLVLHFCLPVCEFPLQETASFFPILLSFSLCCKNYILLNMAANHVVMLSTDNPFSLHT